MSRTLFSNPIEIKISRADLIELIEQSLNRDYLYGDHKVLEIEMHPMSQKVLTITVGPMPEDEPVPELEPEITKENLEEPAF